MDFSHPKTLSDIILINFFISPALPNPVIQLNTILYVVILYTLYIVYYIS